MRLSSGDWVPHDLRALTSAGEEVTLGSILDGADTLAIFLRHLG